MSITSPPATRKRQRKPTWKAEEMSSRAKKSRRIERRPEPATWDLHDLGQSDDDEPPRISGARLAVRVRLRLRPPSRHKQREHSPQVPGACREVPVRIRLRAPSEPEQRSDTGKASQASGSHRKVPVCIRLRTPSGPKERRQGTLMPNFPRDVLLKIFSYLQAVPDLCMMAQVCTQWAEAATIPELWNAVKATDAVTRRLKVEESKANYQYICYDNPFQVVSNGKRQRKWKRRKLRGVRQAVEVITRRGGRSLVSLDLEDCFPLHPNDAFQMRNEDLEKISRRSAQCLEELRISPSPQISGQALVALARSCPKLRILHMSGCRTLSLSQFGEIVRSCPSLEDISVRQCPSFRGGRLDERLFPVRGTLKRLDISDTLTTRFPLSKFASKFPVLEEIKADNCEYMHILDHAPNPTTLQGSLFPRLVSLNIDKITHLPLKWLIAICRTCPWLQILSANKVQQANSSICDLFRGPLPALQHLSLSGQPLNDEAWQCIFEALRGSLVQCDLSRNISLSCVLCAEEGQTFEVLEELNVSGTGATDWTVQEVMRLAPKLTFLDISGCRSVENRDFRRNPLAFRWS